MQELKDRSIEELKAELETANADIRIFTARKVALETEIATRECKFKVGDIIEYPFGRQTRQGRVILVRKNLQPVVVTTIKKDGNDGAQVPLYEWDVRKASLVKPAEAA